MSLVNTTLAMRGDLTEACDAEWARLARAGNWWSGEERVAIAAAARAALECGLCKQRKQSLSPYGGSGAHDGPAWLDSPVVDAAHRIRTDAARLTKTWLDDEILTHLSAAEYVELVGVVVTETFVDTLALALGAPFPAFPAPDPGEPSREPPPFATVHSAWIPTVLPERAEGLVADVYGRSSYAVVSNVIRGLSLVPQELAGQGVRGGSTYRSRHVEMTKPQVELVATATSAANDCFY